MFDKINKPDSVWPVTINVEAGKGKVGHITMIMG